LEFTEVLFPATNTLLSFQSLLGYATTTEVARVQISTNSGAWVDIFTQAGTDGPGQAAFASQKLSLSNCAGRITLLRFNYDFAVGNYFPQTSPATGWCLEDIVLTNVMQIGSFFTNATASTNFNFVPAS